ncbi:MAG: hypothetical protein K5790_05510 [Nitrosopumilus sp.]|nr:hypothetical protein [Nitrosopumilus sp.]MCV0392737.1 hypothetical protein [Nitrosopumilus sp.]
MTQEITTHAFTMEFDLCGLEAILANLLNGISAMETLQVDLKVSTTFPT